ncbi:MAG: DUF6273 domain-containing protein [Clostridiaceae bacterium]|nr:DUF6273 domain-containing protein [Clostridiaceae bacterium]
MKNVFKRTLAILLMVVMLLSVAPVAALGKTADVSEAKSDVSLKATNPIGNALLDGYANEQKEEEQEYVVTSVNFSGKKATVSFGNVEACKLIVAIYNEDGQMLGSVIEDVDATAQKAEVEVNVITMPEHFIAKAYLVDSNLAALCNAYYSIENTQYYEDFMNKTEDDFKDNIVISFDEKKDDNFAVLKDGAVNLKVTANTNILVSADHENQIYKFSNIDDGIKNLKPGDVFSHGKTNADLIVVKVKSININGTNATIYGDTQAEIRDYFDFVKVNLKSTGAEDEMNIDMSQSPEGIEYLGMEKWDDDTLLETNSVYDSDEVMIETQGIEVIDNGTLSCPVWEMKDLYLVGDKFSTSSVKIEGSIKASIRYDFVIHYDAELEAQVKKWGFIPYVDVDYNDYYFVKLTFENSVKGSISLTGEVSKDFLVACPTFVTPVGITVGIGFRLHVEASASVTVTIAEISNTVGIQLEKGGDLKNLTTSPKVEVLPNVDGEVEFKLGVKISPSISFIKLIEVSINPEVGFLVGMTLFEKEEDPVINHICKTCFNGKISFYTTVKIAGDIFTKNFANKTIVPEYEVEIKKFYWSVDFSEFGWGMCPHTDSSAEGSASDGTGSSDSTFTGTESTGTVINFGSYPQSKVTDSTTIAALDKETKNWKSYNYYSGTGDTDDGNMKPSDFMLYADFKYNGDKYRAVTFSEYRPLDIGYTSSVDFSGQYDNGYYTGNVYYFKYEPLKWRVLDASTGLVVCDSIIDSQAYNNYMLYADGKYWGDSSKTYYASNWERSSLRDWLNKDFYNTAFSKAQQSRIQELTRENKSTYISEYDSNPTTDKITLLSYWDVLNESYGFKTLRNSYDNARQRKTTDYAKCQGCGINPSFNGNSEWLLRSSSYSDNIIVVSSSGSANIISAVGVTDNGIVPALNLINSSTSSDGKGSNDSVFTGTEATGTVINFGSYPQSKVTDSTTISALDKETKNWKSYNYYSGTGDTDDGNMKPSDFMLYADFKYNGDKYRAVKFSKYRPHLTGETFSSDNSEQDDNGFYLNNVYYFKYEPLKWRILDASEGLIMCENIIDSQAYNNFIYYDGYSYYNSMDCKNYISNWETSSLRKWLSEDFYYTAFSKSQQSRILTSHNENKSTYLSDFDGAETDDKVFLLSYWEVLNSKYGFDSGVFSNDKARMLQGTDYAKCQGLYVCKDVDLLNNSWLRLRSPGDSSFATEVSHDGWVNYVYDYYDTTGGIAPVLRIEKSSITTSSILSSEIAADDAVVEVTPNTITTAQTVSAAIANGEFTLSSAVDGSLYMVYGVTDYNDGFTLSADNLVYIDQSEGKDGKVTLTYKPSRTDNATVIVVGDFGSGIEARKVELKTGYTVTWNIDGNTVTQTYAPGDKLTPPTVPTKDGYDFKGWDKTVPSTMPDKDLTFTAVYEKVSERKTVKSVSIDDISLNYKKSAYLNPNITADEGAKYTVTYYSSNTKVAKVDGNGRVTATKKGSGSAIIACAVTDEYGNIVTDTCTVNVSLNFGQKLLVYVLFGWIWY